MSIFRTVHYMHCVPHGNRLDFPCSTVDELCSPVSLLDSCVFIEEFSTGSLRLVTFYSYLFLFMKLPGFLPRLIILHSSSKFVRDSDCHYEQTVARNAMYSTLIEFAVVLMIRPLASSRYYYLLGLLWDYMILFMTGARYWRICLRGAGPIGIGFFTATVWL